MRTKTMERKRYSLRGKKADKSPKCATLSSNANQSIDERTINDTTKSIEGNKLDKSTSSTISSTKRKKVVSKKMSQKNELENEEPNDKKKREFSEDNSTISENNVSVKSREEEEVSVETKNSDGDFPVHNALQHAVACQLSDGCSFEKCSVAKQFLVHYSSCMEGSENCTFCKEMDNMVCRHAQICGVPLEMCCQVPNCDKVRLMFLEEWVKLKHKHNEMMQRVFRGLIHAKNCREKCDLILCKNIKTVLYHTHYCKKDENCKTKKFIIQLCEHHQETCTNDNCDVEFCQENVRRRKEDNEAALNIMQDNSGQNESIVNTVVTPSNLIDFAPWYANMFSNQAVNYANKGTFYPQMNNIISEPFDVDSKQAFRELPDSQQGYAPQEGIHHPTTSPTPNEEIYRTLWQSKDEYNQTTLPKLSPNDLQSLLMSRADEQQILSPITDNRVTYSDVQSLSQQNATSPSSQESELEENPLPLAKYQQSMKPLAINHLSNNLLRQRLQHDEQQLKTQSEWSKIDFVKRQFNHQQLDVEEPNDDSDNDSFSKRDDDSEDNMTAIEKSYIAGFKNKLF